MAAIGTPVIGDPVYGTGHRTKVARLAPEARDAVGALARQALHAAVLGFAHPRDGRTLRFEAPLPTDLAALAVKLTQA